MVAVNFSQIGSFNGLEGGAQVLNNPTSLQFGPDGRLYVTELNGTINALTVELQNGEYVATANEVLVLPNGAEIVKSLQNHNDDGSFSSETNRQVTGMVVTGTATNPVLYISSSDPRIAENGEVNLDTNSGVVTRATWTGTEWEAVDIIRGLPRSEENHATNGLVLSPDGTQLYLAVGGNTNNGAPSQFFSYTSEYALSGTVLEIDLADIENRPILTDAAGGQNGTARQYVYDLPTLDDPSVVNDGVREDSDGLDVAGPWGGNDGLNMAILPADAPLRIFADGLRNNYDLAFTTAGNLYTVDNGSNENLGGNPLDAIGNPTDQAGAGAATDAVNDGGTGDPEPLFLLEDGGYYGHPNPGRANQTLAWFVYDDNGNPDLSVTPNSVSNLADLVPVSIDIQDGFVIDPSKFTGDPARLSQSGIRIARDSPQSNALTTLGSSSNGLVEYTSSAFGGALQGALIVTQFNGNVTVLNLNADGTALEPLIDPGGDGVLGTADDEVLSESGVFPLITGQSQPLDVTTGPDGTLWVAELGDQINVFAPSDVIAPTDTDFDDDGILNVDDPFIRDATNGGSVTLNPGQTLLWDFDGNLDNNLPGPNGYGGGLTGVMINGATDFEQFFQEPSTQPGQVINLDNVKFTTAAGGGTIVIEAVSNGDPIANSDSAEYIFHTGVTIASTVETFTVTWDVVNPATDLTGSFQQIGGYIGTGDQSNYLKLVAIQSPSGEIELLLEDDDVVQTSSFTQADDLFTVPPGQSILLSLEIDPVGAIATPTVTYETDTGTTTVSGAAVDLSGTAVLDAILGNNTVQGQTTGLAVGLLASNNGQPEANTFQAVFNGIEITAADGTPITPSISIDDITVNENDGTATFTVNLSEVSAADVTVDFATADGTAIAGSDYTSTSGTLIFTAGETSQSVTVNIADDALVEPDETFAVNLSNAAGAAIADDIGTGTILNDDQDQPAPNTVFFTLSNNDNLSGLAVTERDIVQFDGTNFSLAFDGSDVGLFSNAIEINAFDIVSDTEVLLSFDEAVSIPGLGTVDDSDIVQFTATSLGASTAGSFSLYLDGSDVGLSSSGEDIDGLTLLSDGSLLLSTTGSVNASGISASDDDILRFEPTSLGNTTAGSFSSFIDGSDIGLGSEDIDGFGVDAAGNLLLSSTSNFSVSGISGADEDIFTFTPTTTGSATSGSFASNLFFDGSSFGLADNDIKGIDLASEPASPGNPSIRIEGEAANSVNFFTEDVSAASGGQALSLRFGPVNESGSATFDFSGEAGTYSILLGTFDENDGQAQFSAELNDAETGATTVIGTLTLDANLGSSLPNAQTAVSPVIAAGISLTPGDSITITGTENGSEFARLDYLEFQGVG